MRETRDSIADIWGERTPYVDNWPTRVDERILKEPERWVQSACLLCSNGCGLDIGVKDDRIVGVCGRAVDAVNHGRLGPKGLHAWVANHSADRLKSPLIRRNGQLEEASWDEAAALQETFGSDGQPGSYTDLDTTEAILHIGHNIAEQQTVLWMRILDRRRSAKPSKLIVIDPRNTPTGSEADIHLASRVGTNIPVLNGLLNLIIEAGQINQDYIEAHTVGKVKPYLKLSIINHRTNSPMRNILYA